jgi:hypothetical protein
VTCLDCAGADHAGSDELVDEPALTLVAPPGVQTPDSGEAGGSARCEYERRHRLHEQRIEAKWGRLAPVAKFLADDPQSTTAWAKGSDGERRLAQHLQHSLGDRAVFLHDRKVPGTRGNIDHLAIAPSGVWVIDAKNYDGKIERRDVGGWFKVDYRLFVSGRNRMRLVDGLDWQVKAVRSALRDDEEVPVRAALCFTDATWKLFAKPFKIGAVWVTWADCLAQLIAAPGPLVTADVLQIATRIAEVLRPCP